MNAGSQGCAEVFAQNNETLWPTAGLVKENCQRNLTEFMDLSKF